ncbi:DNA primase [Cohnella sp. 56]|uniref:DNA primase n=1 Tax=Cohnella sp. 56 TaxID=3113722 RepID=UPI0030E96759
MSNGMIPQETIDEVLRRYDIAETVGRYVQLSRNGKYLKGLCPFHSERTPSFTVTPEKQIFHCYGCGKGGNVVKFIMEIENETFPEAIRSMCEEAGIPINWQASEGEQTPRQKERSVMTEAHAFAAKLYHAVLRNTAAGTEAMNYLRGRGMTDRLIEEFGVGYAPARWDTLTQALDKRGFDLSEMDRGGLLSRRHEGEGFVDRFRDRVMFPIHDDSGKIIAFAGRLMSDGQPKYLNSPESPLFSKSRTLYRFHAAKGTIRKSRQVVLFEGYMDVIKAWSAGVHNGVATMGTALTAEHASLLKRYADEAVVCYDGDDAGMAAASKSIPLLEQAGFRVRVGVLPGKMDPDEYIASYGSEAFLREIVEGAVSALKFQLIYLRKSHILLEEDGKLRYLEDAIKLVARRESATERELTLKELAQEFGASTDSLKQDVFKIRQQEKLGTAGDNPGGSWNNEWNDNRSSAKLPDLSPAYVTAERHLLSWMLLDAETAGIVQERLGDRFQVEDHAAIAAYLYAYYAMGNQPDIGRFTANLQDDRLERAATAIALIDVPFGERQLEDYLRTVERQAAKKDDLQSLQEQMIQADRAGDTQRAAEIGLEIIALRQRLKMK